MPRDEVTNHPSRQGQEAIWLLIALLVPLFVNFWVEQQFEASKIWLLRALVGVLTVLWLAGRLSGAQQKPLPSHLRNLVLALFVIQSLSTILSSNHSIAIFGSLDRANGLLTQLSYLILFCCVATQIRPESSRQLLTVMVLTAVPICFLGLAQAAGWQPFPVLTDARSLITTTLGRANFSGAYLALLLPLTVAAVQASWANNRHRLGYSALVVLEISVIALTQARAAWIAAVVGTGLLFWFQYAPRWSKQLRRLSGLGGGALLVGALWFILERGIASGGSIAARWTIWAASLRLLWSRLWLGYGADTLELYFPAVYPPQLVYYQGRGVVVDRAHNWLLDWSLNYGVVAAVIFLALVCFILWMGWKRLAGSRLSQNSSTAENELGNHWLAACMAAVCAQLVGNLFLFEVAATAVVFWLALAIITAAAVDISTANNPLAGPLWLRRGGAVAAVLVVVGLVWLGSLRPLLADIHSWRGTKALNQGSPSAALAEYETAVKFQPQEAAYHVALALTAAQLNHFEQAESAMKVAAGLRPTDPVSFTQLGAIYAREAVESGRAEQIELAYNAYEQAITLGPTIALSYQQYADLALRSGDPELALLQARQAVNFDATDGVAFGIIGWAQLQAGNLTAAESAFGQAVRWEPGSADFHLGLATVYFQQGRLEAARQALEDSLIRDPVYAPALTLQSTLQIE